MTTKTTTKTTSPVTNLYKAIDSTSQRAIGAVFESRSDLAALRIARKMRGADRFTIAVRVPTPTAKLTDLTDIIRATRIGAFLNERTDAAKRAAEARRDKRAEAEADRRNAQRDAEREDRAAVRAAKFAALRAQPTQAAANALADALRATTPKTVDAVAVVSDAVAARKRIDADAAARRDKRAVEDATIDVQTPVHALIAQHPSAVLDILAAIGNGLDTYLRSVDRGANGASVETTIAERARRDVDALIKQHTAARTRIIDAAR